jgi:hypothetical protein
MKYKKLLCLLLSIGFLQLVSSQKSVSESEQVATTVTELYNAMVDRNGQTLDKLTADEMTYGHSSGKMEDKQAFIKEIVDGPYDYLTITNPEQTITIAGKNAVVRHRFNVQATNDGAPASLTLGVLMVFQKQGKAWKLLARQGYKL